MRAGAARPRARGPLWTRARCTRRSARATQRAGTARARARGCDPWGPPHVHDIKRRAEANGESRANPAKPARREASLRKPCANATVAAHHERARRVEPCRESASRTVCQAIQPRIDGMAIRMNRSALFGARFVAACGGGHMPATTEGELGQATDTSKPGELHGAGIGDTTNDPHTAFRKSYVDPGGMWMPSQLALPQHV